MACGLAYYLNGEAQVCGSVNKRLFTLKALALRRLRLVHCQQRVQRVRSLVQGNTAAPANDTQAKAGSEATADNYTAQYTVYTQRGKSLADEVRVAGTQFI